MSIKGRPTAPTRLPPVKPSPGPFNAPRPTNPNDSGRKSDRIFEVSQSVPVPPKKTK